MRSKMPDALASLPARGRLLALLLTAAMALVSAAEAGPAGQDNDDAELKFVPPADAGPDTRVDGRARGQGDAGQVAYVLATHPAGLTASEQPVIFWFLAKPTEAPCIFTITRLDDPKPLLQVELDGRQAGIHRVDLAGHNVKLDPDVEYQVGLEVREDARHRTRNPAPHASIRRRAPPDALVKRLLTRSSGAGRASIYAGAGYWYDALSAISEEIDQHPGDAALRSRRAQLLRDGDLQEVAAFDLRAAREKQGEEVKRKT